MYTCVQFFDRQLLFICSTSKSLSEALIFASTNPQYDERLFIELQVQCMKIPSSNLGRTCCVQKLFLTFRTIYVYNMFSTCSELEIFMYWTRNSMNNLLSYCGLVDTRISASEKDLPVKIVHGKIGNCLDNNWRNLTTSRSNGFQAFFINISTTF